MAEIAVSSGNAKPNESESDDDHLSVTEFAVELVAVAGGAVLVEVAQCQDLPALPAALIALADRSNSNLITNFFYQALRPLQHAVHGPATRHQFQLSTFITANFRYAHLQVLNLLISLDPYPSFLSMYSSS